MVLVVAVLVALIAVSDLRFTGYAIFDDSGLDLAQGTFENTTFDGSAIVLSGSNFTGAYTSKVFDANYSAQWNNLTWTSSGQEPIFFVRGCDDILCDGDEWNEILLVNVSNITLVQPAQYFQYRALFYNTTNGSTNISNVSIDYTVLPITLNVSVNSPEYGGVYGTNVSLDLNYTISGNPQACWYSIDEEAIVVLPTCESTTFNVSENGTHTLTLYANATDNHVSSKTVNFSVYQGYPTVLPIFPEDGTVFNSSLQFDYYVNSTGLTGCSLFADFGGSWGTSDTDTSPENGEINSFSQTPSSDGEYSWGVECNDLNAQSAVTLNKTVGIDRVAPQVAIEEPSGTFNSKAKIPVSLSVTDATTATCIYSLNKVGAGTVLVVVMPQCQGTSFNVAEDGEYTLAVTVTDAGGNVNTQTSSFLVQSDSTSTSETGSSGGGVSVDVGSLVIPKLAFADIGTVSLKPGFSESTTILVSNAGNKFLNNCHLIGKGEYSSWIQSTHVESMGAGQKGLFDLTISIPRDVLPGEMILPLTAKCDEFEQTANLKLSIQPADFLLNVLGYYRKGTALVVNYSLEDLTGNSQTVAVHYSLRDSNNLEVTFGDVELTSSASSLIHSSFTFELPKDSYGEYTLLLEAITDSDKSSISQPVLLTANGATGLAISDNNKHTLAIWGAIVVIVGVLYGAWYFVRRMRLRNAIVSV